MLECGVRLDSTGQLATVHLRHFNVGDDDIDGVALLAQKLPGFLSVLKIDDLETRLAQVPHELHAKEIRVFRQHDSAVLRREVVRAVQARRAVVFDGGVDLAGLVEGTQHDRSCGRFPLRFSLLRRFDSMIDGIANQVRQRIPDRFDNRLVQFDFRAMDHQPARTSRVVDFARSRMDCS